MFLDFNEIQTINKSDNKSIMLEYINLVEGWFYCCINNDIFSVKGNIDIKELIICNINMVKNIITLGCYLYFLKYTENNISEIKYINEIKNNKINVYLMNNYEPGFVFNKENLDEDITIYYIYDKN